MVTDRSATTNITFDEVMVRWDWKPIRDCPGRYLLNNADRNLSVSQVLGISVIPRKLVVEKASDTVLVVSINGGGLISYLRAEGTCLHTLNTTDGFHRKLIQLGVLRE